MPLTTESKSRRIGYMAVLGGILMLIDTLWGGIAVLPLDWGSVAEIALGISLVIGFPMYMLDFWSGKRLVLFLPALFIFRWITEISVGTSTALVRPWRGSVLLIAASVLLQLTKSRSRARM
jgi:hypothetical protein